MTEGGSASKSALETVVLFKVKEMSFGGNNRSPRGSLKAVEVALDCDEADEEDKVSGLGEIEALGAIKKWEKEIAKCVKECGRSRICVVPCCAWPWISVCSECKPVRR